MGLDMYLKAERKVPGLNTEGLDFDRDENPPSVYLSGYSFAGEEEQKRYAEALKASGLESVAEKDSPGLYVMAGDPPKVLATVAYWRKANAIHKWFVDECQGGVDECQLSDPISREKLVELRGLCQRVVDSCQLVEGKVVNGYTGTPQGWEPIIEDGKTVANPAVAEEVLPTASGFFFGGTDYDEYYMGDITRTIAHIDRVLQAPDDTVFRYRSSW
jgi:hypothetical protein